MANISRLKKYDIVSQRQTFVGITRGEIALLKQNCNDQKILNELCLLDRELILFSISANAGNYAEKFLREKFFEIKRIINNNNKL